MIVDFYARIFAFAMNYSWLYCPPLYPVPDLACAILKICFHFSGNGVKFGDAYLDRVGVKALSDRKSLVYFENY